jgi:hypothetical protein
MNQSLEDWDREQRNRDARREKAEGPYKKWAGYLHLANWGHGLPVFERLRDADRAIREQRHANNVRGGDYEGLTLAVRVCAATFADQIAAAAPDPSDPTLLWVLAGLRCTLRPFCTGCTACQSITSPLRPSGAP